MPELWIDEHLGDEAVARPDFRAHLRATLAAELHDRHTPWRRIAWAIAAAAAAIAVVYVVARDDDAPTLQPITSEITTTTEFLQGEALAARITGPTWYVVSKDGVPITNGADFVLGSDGVVGGYDGCNSYGQDISVADGWSLNGRIFQLPGEFVITSQLCEGRESIIPLVDNSVLSLDGETLTITNDHIYTASTDPADQLDLDIPATGGAEVEVQSLTTVPQTTIDPPMVALMSDAIAVLLMADDGRLSGDVLLYSLDGTYLRTATLPPRLVKPLWLGGGESSLLMAQQPTPTAMVTMARYDLDGDRFVRNGTSAATTPQSFEGRRLHVTPGDGITGDDGVPGLGFGEPVTGATASIVPWVAGGVATVQRTETNGSITTWEVRTDVDVAAPPVETVLAIPFDEGVLLQGSTSAGGDGFLAWLGMRDSANPWRRLGEWKYADAKSSTVIVTRSTEAGLEIGIARPS